MVHVVIPSRDQVQGGFGLRTQTATTNRTWSRRERDRARSLAEELEQRIDGEVRFDEGSRALYASDLSIYRQVPIGVVVPRSIDDVVATVAAARSHDVPVLGRGAGTSLAGQTCNVAVVIDFSKYLNRIQSIDPERRLAHVEPGVICDQLRHAAKEHGLTFEPHPGTHAYCTLGGMIGNNSCGAHSQWAGKTVDQVQELDILTYRGDRLSVGETSSSDFENILRQGGRRADIYRRLADLRDRYADEIRSRFPRIPRRISGYNLDELLPEKGFHVARALVGTESTCAIVLGATLRLRSDLPARALMVLGYPDAGRSGDHVPTLNELGPTAIDAFHVHIVENLARKHKPHDGARLLPEGKIWLLVEFGGETGDEANARARDARRRIEQDRAGCSGIAVLEDAEDQAAVWEIRELAVGASRVSGEEHNWPTWEDAGVPPERLGDYLRDFSALVDRYAYSMALYGHYGQGCVHARIGYDLKSAEGIRKFRAFLEDASDLVVRYGGSLSAEHGDGQAKGEFLPKMFGPSLVTAFREFKSIWDPDWRMNPGKVVSPYRSDENLRLGSDYAPRQVETHFKFPDDHGSFALATERCFGVGKCRKLGGQVMCPSFQATREEMHTTRGRARLLFEMLRGDAIEEGWKSEAVRQALDLCLQCKGCKHDCPTSVDMATYKAEFFSHYYEGRLRPRAAYSMGLIFWWARAAMLAPGLVNAATDAPLLGRLVRAVTGFTENRPAPKFAPETFQHWFQRVKARRQGESSGQPVILWPDTFNNYFTPRTAAAAVEVLEDAGCRVIVPKQALCCGRPLYDYGMLDLAKRKLEQAVDALRPAIRAGVPVVGLEPSCISVFRDEMLGLMPNDEDARRLSSQTLLLSEFLAGREDWEPPRLERRVVGQMHCHHKALMDTKAQQDLLKRMGVEVDYPASGCCGQAGSFGYEPEHFDVSMRIGEHELLPAVREAPADAVIMADGFSCRQQIEHGSGRRALHFADVLQMALHEGTNGSTQDYPELRYRQEEARGGALPLVLGTALAAAGVLWFRRSRRQSVRNGRVH